MATIITKLAANKLYSELISKIGTIVLTRLNEIDNAEPSPVLLAVLKQAYDNEGDKVFQFQMKKSLRLMTGKLKTGKSPQVTPDQIENLLRNQSNLDDLALAVACLDAAGGFLAADQLRGSDWQSFPIEIIPSFCNFFKKYGGFEDIPVLLELTRSTNSIIATSAIDALETIDPTNLLGIVEPLLTSPSNIMRAQAIQVYYKWNRKDAIALFSNLLSSPNEQDKTIAIFHAEYFAYEDIEDLLIKILPQITNQYNLMNIMKIFVKNAYEGLPLKIFALNKNISGEQQSLIKGVLLNVIRELVKKDIIKCSVQEYLAELKQQSENEQATEAKEENVQEKSEKATDIQPKQKEITQEQEKQSPDQKIKDEPVLDDSSVEEVKVGFDNFESMPEKKRIQLLAKTNYDLFTENQEKLVYLFEQSEGKVLASFITLFSKYADKEVFAGYVKELCKSDNIDVVCSCIKALSKLDTDYLCLYLPKYLQHPNGKIRMTATRVCAEIDPKQVERLITGMLNSVNTKQRAIGISTTMLVNFQFVKEPLLTALSKESNVDLIKNISMVLAANPDKDILYRVYEISKTTRIMEGSAMDAAINLIAEKLSVSLNHTEDSIKLKNEAAQKYKEIIQAQKQAGIDSLQNRLDGKPVLRKSSNNNKIPQKQEEEKVDKLGFVYLIFSSLKINSEAAGEIVKYFLYILSALVGVGAALLMIKLVE